MAKNFAENSKGKVVGYVAPFLPDSARINWIRTTTSITTGNFSNFRSLDGFYLFLHIFKTILGRLIFFFPLKSQSFDHDWRILHQSSIFRNFSFLLGFCLGLTVFLILTLLFFFWGYEKSWLEIELSKKPMYWTSFNQYLLYFDKLLEKIF